jgi:muramoyltetrapeptide carboxypeptidase
MLEAFYLSRLGGVRMPAGDSRLVFPPALNRGDKIAITSVSWPASEDRQQSIHNAIPILNSYGLKVVISPFLKSYDTFGVATGTPVERAKELQDLFKDSSVNGVWLGQGGDAANHILHLLDYTIFRDNPKFLIGLSDNTVLLNAIVARSGLVTFMGPEPKVGGGPDVYLESEYSRRQFESIVMGNGASGVVAPTRERRVLREGAASGHFIGGNLPSTVKTIETQYMPNSQGAILLVEALSVTKHEALTMLYQLRSRGVFNQISGMLVGRVFSFENEEQRDYNGARLDFLDLINEATDGYGFPVMEIGEFGHRCPGTFLPIGGSGQFSTDDKEVVVFRSGAGCATVL